MSQIYNKSNDNKFEFIKNNELDHIDPEPNIIRKYSNLDKEEPWISTDNTYNSIKINNIYKKDYKDHPSNNHINNITLINETDIVNNTTDKHYQEHIINKTDSIDIKVIHKLDVINNMQYDLSGNKYYKE